LPSPQQKLPLNDGLPGELRVAFEREYGRRYGHTNAANDIELVELVAEASYALPVAENGHRLPESHEPPAGENGRAPTRVTTEVVFGEDERAEVEIVPRASLAKGQSVSGPIIIYESGSVTLVPPDAQGVVLDDGCLSVRLAPGKRSGEEGG
jgi:N-methylhydantoinase A/oxoprolinase/acetone carboxylase beta subunit